MANKRNCWEMQQFCRGIGGQIRSRRKKRGMSQAALGRLVGLTRASVSNIENGRQSMSLFRATQVAAALGMTLRLEETTNE